MSILKKDQSYVLHVLGQDILGRLMLPLGDYKKDDIRTIARSLNLAAADRPESQEICFIEDNNYSGFIEKLSPETGGPVPSLTQRAGYWGPTKASIAIRSVREKGSVSLPLNRIM